MVDDVVKKARGDLERIAARALARQEASERALARLRARRDQRARDRARAETSGDPDLVADIDRSLEDLDAQLDLANAQHADATATFDAVKKDLSRLETLEAEARVEHVRRTAGAITSGGDPFAPSAEDIALENARNAILELEARLEVMREMAGESENARDAARKVRQLEEAERDARAQETLDALKQAKKQNNTEGKKRTL